MNRYESIDSLYTQNNLKDTDLSNIKTNMTNHFDEPLFSCCLCSSNATSAGSFVVLSCNHVYHIKCLVDVQLIDVYKYPSINEEYLNTLTCQKCSKKMSMEEILFIHSKFISETNTILEKFNEILEKLDNQLKSLKEEVRASYDYKFKLKRASENSKQITSIVSAMI